MRCIDLIRENKELLTLLESNGINPHDVSYLHIVDEYTTMKDRGFKVTFAIQFLSEKYGVSVANLYRAIRRFNSTIKF